MKRFMRIFAAACLSAVPAIAQGQSKLGIIVRAEHQSYSLRADVELVIIRENQGKQNLLIPREWGWGVMRTNIRVFDAKGQEVRTDFLFDALPPPPRPYDFVLLRPGEFFGTHLIDAAKKLFNKPGVYELVVEYTSYLAENYAREVMKMPSVPFWSREEGTVISNRIMLCITD